MVDHLRTVNKLKPTYACIAFFSGNAPKTKKGRFLERSEHADLIYENKVRMDQDKELYRRRQAIVEHPYGIIKRQWGFSANARLMLMSLNSY